MAFDAANRLIRLGMATQLASEIARQIGTGAGDPLRLISLGVPYPLADEIAKQINAGAGQAQRLMALGVAYPLAIEMAEQILPAGPRLSVALSGPMTPGSTVTLTASITGAETPVTSLASVSLTVGGSAVTLSGTGLVRTGKIPAGAMAGASIVAGATAVADGNTISGGATSTVVAIPVAPPVAAGAIPDQTWTVGTAVSLNVSTDFTGTGITYALAPSSSALPAGLSLSAAGVISGTPTAAATGTIVVRGTNGGGYADTGFGFEVAAAASALVSLDGWTIETATPASMVGQTIMVQRAGFNASGAAVTVSDPVKITDRLRQPYPNHNSKTTDKVVLGEYIHVGDVVSGMTNMSLKPAANPLTCWLQPDYFGIEGATFTVDLAVLHKFARNGRPVAAVRIIASDGTTTREQLVSTLTFASYSASGLGADVFRATFTSADFAVGAQITIDAIIYPWVGPAYRLSVDGNPAPNMKNTVLRAYRLPQVYAYVDPVAGTSSGVASLTAATAAATPFQTILQAATAVRDFNSTTHGRNELGGGVIRLVEGTTVLTGNIYFSATASTTSNIIIEAANPSKRASTFLDDNGVNDNGEYVPRRVTFRNLTIRKTVAASNLFRAPDLEDVSYVFDGCVLDMGGFSIASGGSYMIQRIGRSWFINTSHVNGDGGFGTVSGTQKKNLLVIGSSGIGYTGVISAIASKTGPLIMSTLAAITLGRRQGMVYNCIVSGGHSDVQLGFGGDWLSVAGYGYGVVGTVVESYTVGSRSVRAWADGDGNAVRDFMVMATTMPGQGDVEGTGFNRLYNDTAGLPSIKDMAAFKYCIFPLSACKTDVHAQDGANIGNWPIVMGVGLGYNCAIRGVNVPNSQIGPGSWRWEILPEGYQVGDGAGGILIPQWTNNQTVDVGGSGGGDYRPLSTSPLIRVPAGQTIMAHDMLGKAIPTDGTAFIGALQAA